MEHTISCRPVSLHFEHYVPNNCNVPLTPMIFVHGLADSGMTWRNVVKRIANETQREAYVIDLRNHGQTEWTDVFSLDTMCADIENLMLQNGIEKSILVTHSLGAKVCMYIALKKPELVDKIIVEEATLSNPEEQQLKLAISLLSLVKKINLLPKSLSEKEVRNFLASRAKELFPENSDIGLVFYTSLRRDSNDDFQIGFNAEAAERSLRDRSAVDIDLKTCQKYTGPALILYGANSTIKVDEDKLLPEYFPNAEFYRFENGGHVLHKQNVDEYIQKVCTFINN